MMQEHKLGSILYILYFILILISCRQQSEIEELYSVNLNEDHTLNLENTTSGESIISGISASCQLSGSRVILMPDKNSTSASGHFSDAMGEGREIIYKNQKGVKWILRIFKDQPAIAARLDITNTTDTSFRVDRLDPIVTSGNSHGIRFASTDTLRFLDIEPETWAYKNVKILDGTGTGRFVTGVASEDGKGIVIGCLSFDRFRGVFKLDDNRKTSGLLAVNAHNQIDDHMILGPGETLESEWILIDCVDDVLKGLENWAKLAGNINNAVFSDPPATGFYTWYYYRDYVSEKIMLDNTKFLSENRDRFPVNFVHIDWGWQHNYSSGDTIPNDKFPHGLSWVAQYIRDHGFHPSLWVNPFMYTNPTAQAVVKHPDIFLRKENGELVSYKPIRNIMANAWGDAEYMISEGVINTLDVTNPDAYDFLGKRYKWVSSMGFDMAMMDFIIYGRTSYERGDRVKNPDISTLEGIKKALLAAREGLGKSKNVLGCGTMYEPSIGTSNLTRISLDATANWPSVKMASRDLIIQYFMNNNLWTNYADGIFVRDKPSPYWGEYELDEEGRKIPMFVTEAEAQFYTAVTGLSQAAVMYTEDIQRLAPERQWLLSLLLPIYQDGKFRPVDLFRSIPSKTLQLECSKGDREWIIAAGLNWSEEVIDNGLDLNLLNLEDGKRYHAFNVFEKEYIRNVSSDEILGPINAHGVILVNLVKDLNHPQVVGTDLHISQGGVEISNEIWNDEEKKLLIYLNDLEGRKGSIYIHIPDTFRYVPENHQEIIVSEDRKILKIPMTLSGEKSLTLEFE